MQDHLANLKSKLLPYLQSGYTKVKELWTWATANKLRALIYSFGIGCLLVLLLLLLIYAGAFGKLPSAQDLRDIRNPLATTLYSGDKEIIGYFYTQNRSNMDSSQVNKAVHDALVATEDHRFYEHNGIDWRSLGRVLVKSILLQKRSSGGGSTITQQLAKNVYGRQKRGLLSTPVNKIREMFIARRMESVYTKEEILLLYLNTVPFGEKLYGMEKAAQRYYNKRPEKLTIDEAAVLVGSLKASTYYNPRKNPDNSKRRRNTVMQQMIKYEFLDSVQYEKLSQLPIKLNYSPPKAEQTYAGHFKDLVKKEFEIWSEENRRPDGEKYNIYNDGLKIYTTLHNGMQQTLEKAVTSKLADLQVYFKKGHEITGGTEAAIMQKIKASSWYKRLDDDLKNEKSIDQLINSKAKRSYWDGSSYVTDSISMADSVLAELITLQSGAAAIHNASGKIMAYVGGKDYGYSQYDHVQLPKQVGSTFKPIAYLAALQSGGQPCDFFDNELRTYSNYDDWAPKNANGQYGGAYAMYGALANSVNTVSIQVLFKAGPKAVVKLARSMGIGGELPAVPSIVLGTGEIPLIDMVSAYGGIAQGGKVMQPYAIWKIEDEDGKVLYEAKPTVKSTIAATPEQLSTLRQMMTYTNRIGTGKSMQAYGIPYNLIAKTGTTQRNADGWYIAASPEITCGAWVGTSEPRVTFKTSMGSGSSTALPIVGRFFGYLSSWRSQIISNFSFDQTDFGCLPYSDLPASEADSLARISPESLMRAVFGFGIASDSTTIADTINETKSDSTTIKN